MATAVQVGERSQAAFAVGSTELPFYSITDLARRWRCSRASVYRSLRGEKVLDFAANGRKGHKLVPFETVRKIERTHLRVLR